jgi:hypothetical protein
MPEIYQIWHESNEYKTNNTLIATTDYTSNYLVCIKVKPKTSNVTTIRYRKDIS